MTEIKKKPTKKEEVENNEDGLKPAKKVKIKEIKEKAVKQEIEEETMLDDPEAVVITRNSRNR